MGSGRRVRHGVEEQALWCVEGLADVELFYLFALIALGVEIAVAADAAPADAGTGRVAIFLDIGQQRSAAWDRVEGGTCVVSLRLEPGLDLGVFGVFHIAVGVRDGSAEIAVRYWTRLRNRLFGLCACYDSRAQRKKTKD